MAPTGLVPTLAVIGACAPAEVAPVIRTGGSSAAALSIVIHTLRRRTG